MTTESIIPKVRPPSVRERFLAANTSPETIVTTSIGSQGEAVTHTHTTDPLVVLYRATTWGWESTAVPSGNVEMCLHFGMKEVCGDCGTSCSPDPFAPTPNACKGHEPFASYRCPECARIFYDFESRVTHPNVTAPMQSETEDVAAIKDDLFSKSTPASRLKALVEAHIARYHDSAARRLGLVDPDGRRGG